MFFELYYKKYKTFFRIDMQLYQHSLKFEKLEIVSNTTLFPAFRIFTRVNITVYQHGKCFVFLKCY